MVMKGTLLILSLIMAPAALNAQNLQLHYDFGKARNGKDRAPGFFTSTVEMLHPDRYGSTFFFIDLDYNGYRGVSRGYTEIARNTGFAGFPLQARLEYNGGVLLSDTTRGLSIPNAWLIGINYPIKLKSGKLGTYLVYKHIAGTLNGPDFQWTLNWNYTLLNGKITFNGFFDLWSADKTGEGKKLVVLSEPQIWFNIQSYLAIGSEFELSRNFYSWMDGFCIFPTAAIKVVFKNKL